MQSTPLQLELVAFFDAFVRAFESFDGARVAERYSAPYLALQADGSSQCFTTDAAANRGAGAQRG